MKSETIFVHCRQCHRDGAADIVMDHHTEYRPIIRCGYCNSINVKVIEETEVEETEKKMEDKE